MDSLKIRLENAYKFLYGNGSVKNKQDFAQKIGVSKSYLSDAFADRNRKLTENFLLKIADAFPDLINKDYMLTGEGSLELDPKEYRPHLADVAVAAGFMNGIAEQAHEFEMRELMPQFSDYDFSINVTGDSMLPDIHPGDTVYCRIEQNRYADVVGKLCLIDTNDGAVLKIIKKEGKDNITLHSFNPDYKDYQVKFEDIIRIGRIVGLTRKF